MAQRAGDPIEHNSFIQDPELLLTYLKYAARDVRALSERAGICLDAAITALDEDTSVVVVSDGKENPRRVS